MDEFLFCGSTMFLRDVIKIAKEKFKIGAEANNTFKYLDHFVSQTNNGIKISQNVYIENLKAAEVPLNKSNEEILTKNERSQLRLTNEQMFWVGSQTRPDTAFGSCKIANY